MMFKAKNITSTCIVITIILLCTCATASANKSSVSAPSFLWVNRLTTTAASISWSNIKGATRYDVLQNGRKIASVKSSSVSLRNLKPAEWYELRVRAYRGKQRSTLSDPLPIVTQASPVCTLWVSPSRGSDLSSGKESAPFRSVQHLVDVWNAGDVGCLLDSATEDITISHGGTKLAKITLRSAPKTRATILGRIQLAKGADNVVISSLNLDGRAINGVGKADLPSPTVNANDTMFIDNDVYNQQTRVCFVIGSIRGWGRAVRTTLVRNRIHDCGARDTLGKGNNHHHGVYVEGADYTRIVSNVIFNNADRGIQLYPDAQNSLIAGNVIVGNGEGIIFSGAEGFVSSGNLVLQNVVSNSRTRSNIEHWWENPLQVGNKNLVTRNCIGPANQGAFATPIVGYRAILNTLGNPRWRNSANGDFRLLNRAGQASCALWLRSRGLPLAPFTP